ncbi:MAG TPA: DUF3592 domain-containing protein [Chthoniobacterales bacterium]|jgi:hypothetical protein
MDSSDVQRNGHGPLGCAIPLLIGGLAFVLLGCLWHQPHLTRTVGVIVESKPPIYGQTRRVITYEYVANGVRHRGQRFLSTAPQFVGMFDSGASFPVYFDNDHPDQSYAPNAPRMWGIVVIGVMFSLLGGVVLLFGKPQPRDAAGCELGHENVEG